MQTIDDLAGLPYKGPSGTPKKLANDLKMLYQVNPGNIVYIVGRLLQPFCSHALYRVQVTHLHNVGKGCYVIHGSLIDFKDSPVKSYAISGKQLFRVETVLEVAENEAPKSLLSRDTIRRIAKEQGLSAGFRDIDGAVQVDVWEYLGPGKTKEGKKTTIAKKRRLGRLEMVEQLTEEDLAILVRTKFGKVTEERQEQTEKVEV